MVEFLSEDWIAALDGAAGAVIGSEDFVIQQIVTNPPETEIAWYVALSAGQVRVHAGQAATPDVTFSQDRSTALAIAAGELSAGAALTAGRLTVRGATARLTEQRDVLARLDEAFAAVDDDA